MIVVNYHTQASLAQLRKNGSIKVQFETVRRRRMPLDTMLRSRDCCVIDEGMLALLNSSKGLRSLLKDLCFGKNTCVDSELVSPVPNRLYHHSHEVHVLPFLVSQVDQFSNV